MYKKRRTDEKVIVLKTNNNNEYISKNFNKKIGKLKNYVVEIGSMKDAIFDLAIGVKAESHEDCLNNSVVKKKIERLELSMVKCVIYKQDGRLFDLKRFFVKTDFDGIREPKREFNGVEYELKQKK